MIYSQGNQIKENEIGEPGIWDTWFAIKIGCENVDWIHLTQNSV
jgi:hypothetical protein